MGNSDPLISFSSLGLGKELGWFHFEVLKHRLIHPPCMLLFYVFPEWLISSSPFHIFHMLFSSLEEISSCFSRVFADGVVVSTNRTSNLIPNSCFSANTLLASIARETPVPATVQSPPGPGCGDKKVSPTAGLRCRLTRQPNTCAGPFCAPCSDCLWDIVY